MTILGKKRQNPYTVQVVSQALGNLLHQQSGKSGDATVGLMNMQPTHEYYRFKPANVGELMDLEETGFDLWDFPLDTDVEYLGDYYHDPTVPADQITWMYTCIPIGVSFPASIQHEKIADLFLFDEDSGDEWDWDPWDPTECIECPDPTEDCWDPWGRPTCGTMARRSPKGKSGDEQLRTVGITKEALYDEVMRLTGNEDEMIHPNQLGKQIDAPVAPARRYRPAGRITVTDTDNQTTTTVGVQGLLVKSRRWFKLDHTYTNATGNFSIGKQYRKAAVIITKFKNNNVTVRGVSPDFATFIRPWETVFPIKKNIGKFTGTSMENLTYNFPYNPSRTSNEAMCFAAATTLNAVAEARQFNTQLGIAQVPTQMCIWISNRFGGEASATAMMARQIHGNFMPPNSDAATMVNSDVLNFIGNVTHKGIITQIMARNSPDISLKYGMHIDAEQTRFTAEISNDALHELSHASHMAQVGGLYWKDRVHNAYAANFIAHGDAYGEKGNTREGIVAVVEAWGYFMGSTLNRLKYFTDNPVIAQNELDRLENQRPLANPTSHFNWIPYGMLHDMTDNGEPLFTGVTDQVNTYTIPQIFSGYRNNVLDVQGLKNEILSRNGNQQAAELNTLVTSYFW